jgi:hypothetical protein
MASAIPEYTVVHHLQSSDPVVTESDTIDPAATMAAHRKSRSRQQGREESKAKRKAGCGEYEAL